MARTRENHLVSEVLALALIGSGLLLLLALISYTPADLPKFFSSVSRTAQVGRNFIGPFGATMAYFAYALLGAAAYLLVALMLGCGSISLMAPATKLPRRWGWCIGFVVAAACLAHVLHWQFIGAKHLSLPGEGGLLGKWIGAGVLETVLGRVGSIIVLLGMYGLCLLLVLGVPPRVLVRQVANFPRWAVDRWVAWRAERAEAADFREPAPSRREARPVRGAAIAAIAPAPAAVDKPAGRRGSKATAAAAPAEDALPFSEKAATAAEGEETTPVAPEAPIEPPRPAPKIFDANAPLVRPDRKEKRDRMAPMTPVSCDNYELPSLDLLDPLDLASRESVDPEELRLVQTTLIETLEQFGISVSPGDITRGPTITRYEVYPAKGVRVDRIVSLERDLARATRAERINILAPIPGKDTVGIEIANSKKQKVALRELLESDEFHSTKCKIPLALGKDVYGQTIIADLAAMPHGLVAGTTGSGKSVCINSIIASILYRFTPADLRFIMIDPKVVEMQMYNTLPHLVVPVVTDPKKVLLALRWAVDEMEKRYAIFAKTGVRNIASFNSRPKPKTQKELDAERGQARLPLDEPLPGAVETVSPIPPILVDGEAEAVLPPEGAPVEAAVDPETLTSEERIEKMTKVRNTREHDLIIPDRMPYIVIIVDELADLMQTAPADVESAIARITQKARAAGLHMIIATQTPRADVITGVIKANVPCRVAFQVASALDSRVILDENGAERLLGMGDMLYRPPGTSRMVRAQGVLVTDDEVRRVVEYASAQGEPSFESSIHQKLEGDGSDEEEEISDEDEELVDKCLEVMRQEKKASTSLFQRRLRLGYTRAARILDILEMRGYVAAGEGAKPREILVDLDAM